MGAVTARRQRQKQLLTAEAATFAREEPRYYVLVREGDCRALAEGFVTDSVREQARKSVEALWPET